MAETTALVANKPRLQALLESMKDSIADVLPRHLTPERVMKMAMVAASRTPRLYECTKQSIAKALMTASELGLDCSGTLGSGYLVPYRNNKTGQYEVQFIAGYRGLIDLARRGGQIKRIEAHPVFENDQFELEFGLEPKLLHKPNLAGDPGKLKLVYAVAELADGSKQLEVMTVAEIEGIRARSKAGNDGPWKTDYNEMARKTVVRRLCKYLPLSAELEQALAAENEAEIPARSVVAEVIDDGRTRTEKLTEKVKTKKLAKAEPFPAPEPITVGDAAYILEPLAQAANWSPEKFDELITCENGIETTAAALGMTMDDLRARIESAKAEA